MMDRCMQDLVAGLLFGYFVSIFHHMAVFASWGMVGVLRRYMFRSS